MYNVYQTNHKFIKQQIHSKGLKKLKKEIQNMYNFRLEICQKQTEKMCEIVEIEKDYNETSINWYLLVPDKETKKKRHISQCKKYKLKYLKNTK